MFLLSSTPTELQNRFNVLSTVESEEDNFKIMNDIQGSTSLVRVAPVKNIIKRSSRCLAVDVSITRFYDVGSGNKACRNLIVSINIEDHTNAITRGKIIVGFLQCRVYEYSDPIQCKLCWRYGHFRHSCKFSPVCRICGKGSHVDAQCDASRDSCANCIRHNRASDDKINVNHRVTDDKCPIRISRNERIKDFLLSKHPRRGFRDPNASLSTALNQSLNASMMVE